MSTSPQILLVSGLYDFSTDLITAALIDRHINFLRINREQLPNYRITLDPVAGLMEVKDPEGNATVVRADCLESVLFRQPVFLRNTPGHGLSPAEQLERSQWPAFLRGLAVFDQARWLNHPAKTYLAESKPYQLSMASRFGFHVPRTRIGNDVTGIRNAQLGSLLILKSLDTVLLREGNDCLFTYSTISEIDNWNDGNFAAVPSMCQEFVQAKTDIRVRVSPD